MLRGDDELNHLYIPWGGMLHIYIVFVDIGSTFIQRFGCVWLLYEGFIKLKIKSHEIKLMHNNYKCKGKFYYFFFVDR